MYFKNPKLTGFFPTNRTADHVLKLRALIDKYVCHHQENVYACFVDFRKALDWRRKSCTLSRSQGERNPIFFQIISLSTYQLRFNLEILVQKPAFGTLKLNLNSQIYLSYSLPLCFHCQWRETGVNRRCQSSIGLNDFQTREIYLFYFISFAIKKTKRRTRKGS